MKKKEWFKEPLNICAIIILYLSLSLFAYSCSLIKRTDSDSNCNDEGNSVRNKQIQIQTAMMREILWEELSLVPIKDYSYLFLYYFPFIEWYVAVCLWQVAIKRKITIYALHTFSVSGVKKIHIYSSCQRNGYCNYKLRCWNDSIDTHISSFLVNFSEQQQVDFSKSLV